MSSEGAPVRPADFGPVPISRLKTEAPRVFGALEQGRRVLVSRRGEVVAVIEPPSFIDPQLLVDYATPGRRSLAQLTATEINRGSPSRAVEKAIEGELAYVTRGNQVYGMLGPITSSELILELTSEAMAARRQRIDDYLSSHPNASAGDVAAISEDSSAYEDVAADWVLSDARPYEVEGYEMVVVLDTASPSGSRATADRHSGPGDMAASSGARSTRMTDPIGDMLTRLRNANSAHHDTVTMPFSRIKLHAAEILQAEGYILGWTVEDAPVGQYLTIELKYGPDHEPSLAGVRRVSKPGLRVFAKSKFLPKALGGLGVAILSTPSGLRTDKQARAEGMDGEVVAYVW